MKGSVSHESLVGVPAGKLWESYGTLGLSKLVMQILPHFIERIDVLEGNGEVGTVLHLHFPGPSGQSFSYKEKFTLVDNEKRVKESRVVEGGYLELGFRMYLVRFEVVEKDETSSLIRSTIEYEIDDDQSDKVSLVRVKPLADIAEAVGKYLSSEKSE